MDLWSGLRDEDLSPEERAERDAVFAAEPVRRRAHDEAIALGRAIAALPAAPPYRRRRAAPRRAPVLVLATALALLGVRAADVVAPPVAPPPPLGDAPAPPPALAPSPPAPRAPPPPPAPKLRARGAGAGAVPVLLRAVAEGPAGVRPLSDGDEVGVDEKVVFEVEAGVGGQAQLWEEDVRVWPPQGSWKIATGRSLPGDGGPVAWRADTPGEHRYVARLCPAPGRCGEATLTLRWEAW